MNECHDRQQTVWKGETRLDKNYSTLEELKREEKQQDLESYITDSIISNIRNYRIFYGFSQRELSRRTGVTQNIISRMENGLAVPQFSTLITLLEALNLDIDIEIKPKK